eukprot:gene5416-6092_t
MKKKPSGNHQKNMENTQTAAVIWLGLSVSIAFVLIAIYIWKKNANKNTRPQHNARLLAGINSDTGAMPAEPAGGMRRRPRTARQRMMRRRPEEEQAEFSNTESDEDDLQVPWKDDEPSGKIGAKKMRKLQEKAEKKERREMEQKEREEKKKQDELKEQERKKEEEMSKLEQEKQEEEERLRMEEQERREYEEYLLLKDSFTVEEEGESGVLSEQESQTLLQEFIDFIKNKKVVLLEELASQFSLRVQEAIQRLQDLQESGRITGVMDDRGKFIYISEDELSNFARYVRQRGRVAISDLAEASNTLISLQGSNEHKQNVTVQ